MPTHTRAGWPAIFSRALYYRGHGLFPIAAYSELMPGPFVGLRPYEDPRNADPQVVLDPTGDRFGISEHEEAHELVPGLHYIAEHLLVALRKLYAAPAGSGHGFSQVMLRENPAWPSELAAHAQALAHERFVLLLPLSLSRTQDDKGRVRWTLFGASEQGPAWPFWRSLPTEGEGTKFLSELLGAAYGMAPAESLSELRTAGLRVLPQDEDADSATLFGPSEQRPAWTEPLLFSEQAQDATDGVRFLLTFRPFLRLPAALKKAYCEGKLHLLPCPASLVFFSHTGYRTLARNLPLAMQIPLLHVFLGGCGAPDKIRIPQAGWLDEPLRQKGPAPQMSTGHSIVNKLKRTHRWNRAYRDEDELLHIEAEDQVSQALFASDAEKLGLYGKPMARNAQIWTADYRLLLDGPRAERSELERAFRAVLAGGRFGYRFVFPAMRTCGYELYWQRPLCAFPGSAAGSAAGPKVLTSVRGYITAYDELALRTGKALGTGPGPAIELWPEILARESYRAAAELFEKDPGHRKHTVAHNVRKLLEARELLGQTLPHAFARALLTMAKRRSLGEWLALLPERAADKERGAALSKTLEAAVALASGDAADDTRREDAEAPPSITFEKTATRAFEAQYFRTIASLAEGPFQLKDNADPVGPSVDAAARRDLDTLGDFLYDSYRKLIERHDLTDQAFVAEHTFRWRTAFDMPWSIGWSRNQTGLAKERNIFLILPGQDRSEAVIMCDHYDTAYMEDVYSRRSSAPVRQAAAGADDNHSATAALMQAAEVLMPLAKAGKLKRDVWLIHLTGEEFPADCLGARELVARLVEGNLAVQADGAGFLDLSKTRIKGAFILDMIAHNSDRERYVFQIAPGAGREAMGLALLAHRASEAWNRSIASWNRAPDRGQPGPSQRMLDGKTLPPTVSHPHMIGEIRPAWHPKSSLYNTDAQIFSDAGIPVVLFMEDYDINRSGYHDSQDTLANIDLDYGAALSAIAIESVAAAACLD